MKRLSQSKGGIRKLVPVIVTFAAIAISLAFLSLWKLSPEVEIALKVNRFSFRSKDDQPSGMLNALHANTLRISNYELLNLGKGRLELATSGNPQSRIHTHLQTPPYADIIIRPQRSFSTLSLKDVTINSLYLSPNSQMIFSQSEDDSNSLLLTTDGDISGEFAVGKSLNFSCSNCDINDSSFDSSSKLLKFAAENGLGSILTFSGRNPTVIGLVLPTNQYLSGQNIKVEDELDFTRMEGSRKVSTISGGQIKLADMNKTDPNKKEIQIDEGKFLSLGLLKEFRIQSIKIDKGINITLHGITGKLMMGSEGYLKDYRPSALEYIYAQERWLLYLQCLAAVMSVVWTFFRIKAGDATG